MKVTSGAKGGIAVLLSTALALTACSSSKSSTGSPPTTAGKAVTSSRGFDGTTIKVAGIYNAGDFAGAEIGAEARFKRANDNNELNGIKIQYVESADDKQDPATATSEMRRLVTSDQVFAIVPDLSAVNPGPYLVSEHVPYVGYAFDNTYCSPAPSTAIWGFGYDGCLVPATPEKMPDGFGLLYKYVSGKTGKAHPSFVLFSNDNQSGKNSSRFDASEADGVGFNVVYAKGSVPIVVSDYAPYVQQWMTADGGKAPDVIACYLAAQCIPIWQAVKAAGYKGYFFHTLGPVDVLTKAMAGTYTAGFYNTAPSPALTQMENDLNAFKPGTKPVGYSNVPAYFAADMFIQALKQVGRDITPEAVQQALAHITWQIQGLVGPITYPASTAVSTPSCSELLQDPADASGYQILEPYTCSTRTFTINSRFTGS